MTKSRAHLAARAVLNGAYELESSLSMINFVAKGLADAFFQFARQTLA